MHYRPRIVIRRRGDGPTDAASVTFAIAEPVTMNLLLHHGVKSCLEYAKSGNIDKARAVSNPDLSPHVSFVDMGGHGYSVVHVTSEIFEAEFVCIPRPIERSERAMAGRCGTALDIERSYGAREKNQSWSCRSSRAMRDFRCEVLQACVRLIRLVTCATEFISETRELGSPMSQPQRRRAQDDVGLATPPLVDVLE